MLECPLVGGELEEKEVKFSRLTNQLQEIPQYKILNIGELSYKM